MTMKASSLFVRQRLQRCSLAAVTIAATVLLSACGGSDSPGYTRLVSFGDSLSDVGTYKTAGVASLGGGKYTVNGPDVKIWVELLAERAGVAKPCAAQTGLEATGPLAGLAQPKADVKDCFGYAQGGSRVTNPVGPANKALIALGDNSGLLGQLTDPLVNQVARHLAASNNQFSGTDIVTVLAGGNDLFLNLATLNAQIGGGVDPTAASTAAVGAMGQAGTELATLVRTRMVANGAQRVVVVTVPDVSKTPFGVSLGASTTPLLQSMVTTFNQKLTEGLNGVSGVIVVDGYALSQKVAAAPADYGVTNATTPACDARAQLQSLSCTSATTVAADVSKYLYADGVHPTPLGHKIYADAAIDAMVRAGWL
jgi:outer membrane lipase/esterase